ncbi:MULTISPECIES: hypothetical protein [Psychrilyobacter]|uniref:Type II secretion system protein n=1 Tax=Psychrilyobacter piezotolerans TaxID=2293438 RepID=A0ABX9KI82_9FUSO|nr:MULTISPECIES: hypothetical protein [Psychrilyobacter]MCS5420222.1 hypothetical protein [Psychrilyobacter sp. S5]NDI77247.1 hypothetical protein [Psychrilyobacter piezotolerans]RDE63305.1 hypothetical protein DV867_05385 [Psychrilyobacter sp. S5]REI41847.1 hypothetical protein DYH56_05385 [Psychrilyobacter piezotolerans]
MNKFIIKADIIFIVLFIGFLSFFTFFKIKNNYSLSSLSSTNKNLTLVRRSIDEFYSTYERYPSENEIRGRDEDRKFFSILADNTGSGFNLLKNFKFPVTPKYTKEVDGVSVEIETSNNIKICNRLENLGLANEFYTSNGGWIYSPKNGEFRANLQDGQARDRKTASSRPKWGNEIDWYYK